MSTHLYEMFARVNNSIVDVAIKLSPILNIFLRMIDNLNLTSRNMHKLPKGRPQKLNRATRFKYVKRSTGWVLLGPRKGRLRDWWERTGSYRTNPPEELDLASMTASESDTRPANSPDHSYDTDSFLIGVDSHASYCMSPAKGDFIPSTLVKKRVRVRGIQGVQV